MLSPECITEILLDPAFVIQEKLQKNGREAPVFVKESQGMLAASQIINYHRARDVAQRYSGCQAGAGFVVLPPPKKNK